MILAQDLRDAVLQAAIQGKLTQQLASDSSVDELLEKIRTQKELLIKEKKIKKEKPLKPISEDEIPFDIPANWKWVRLNTICKSIVDGDHQAPPQTTKGIPFLVISNMVQLPEPTDEKSEAHKAGYQNICEIGKERIRRAGKKITTECVRGGNTCSQNTDIGFRVFKLDDTNMEDVYYTPAELKQEDLQLAISNIKPDRTDLDLLFGCLLEWGLPLSMSYHSEQLDGVTVHTYNDGDLIACFDKNIPESVVKTIAKRQPLRVVFRDDSFQNSPSKINVSEIFKMISPDTRVKVI